MDKAARRLQQIQHIIIGPDTHDAPASDAPSPSFITEWKTVLVLPDGVRASILARTDGSSLIALDARPVLAFRTLARTAALPLSAVGAPDVSANIIPVYPVLELFFPAVDAAQRPGRIALDDLWAVVYVLWATMHAQEVIPIVLDPSLPNAADLAWYLLHSGLARLALPGASSPFTSPSTETENENSERAPELFLDRATFWQGAGTGPAWSVARGWLRHAPDHAPFPHTQSFTRSARVIAQHPLRPPKPPRGTLLYARYCAPVRAVLGLHALDPGCKDDMDAFHRWMNDERVNSGWGEKGSWEKHVEYVRGVVDDPHVLPLIMSWDGARMGYVELVWIKENHVAPYVPAGAQDYDRGLHVLVGEDRFRGQAYSQAWFRSITHYIFLAETRTTRVVGEPKRANAAIVRTSVDAGMHLETSFYFPYKHSVMTMNLRERLFKEDVFH
ncbi:acyl-CoA N-acyltransferase [Phellopilus nigrolimitatus]|nr:acyl-CoA N-acyltransferase [Phellopilus nigrolimitatus]